MVNKKRKVHKNSLNPKRRLLKVQMVFPKKAFETSFSEDFYDSMAQLAWSMEEKRVKTLRDYIR
jgi:hypothetical protein